MNALEEGQEPYDFDEERLSDEFDERESNVPIEIPDEVFPENDGDIDWEDPELAPVT